MFKDRFPMFKDNPKFFELTDCYSYKFSGTSFWASEECILNLLTESG
jgi:hypothetical protein